MAGLPLLPHLTRRVIGFLNSGLLCAVTTAATAAARAGVRTLEAEWRRLH